MAAIEVLGQAPGPHIDNVFPITPPEIPEWKVKLGTLMEDGADVVTSTRFAGAVILNRYIEQTPEYQSWKTAGIFLGFAATDAVDGWLAKTGRRLQGKDEDVRRPFKAYPDQLGDKALVDGVTMAIGSREEKNGNALYAGVVQASGAVYIVRDVVTTVDRVVADIQDIDTRAGSSGKIKTAKQLGLLTIALSPVAKNPLVKTLVGAGFVYTAKESVSSGIDLHKRFAEERATLRNLGELPLQKWRAKREAKRAQKEYCNEIVEAALNASNRKSVPRRWPQ